MTDNDSTEDDVSYVSEMESDTSFLDHSSTIELNIWISNESFLESGKIKKLFENIQAASNGLPQFGASSDYFNLSLIHI